MNNVLFIIIIVVSLIIGWFITTGVKSQTIRLFDIFVFGPVLIWAATMVEYLPVKILLIFFGSTTIAYNTRNFLHEENII